MDRLRAMSVVLAVVDGGSLSAAARTLRVPLPTVSRQLSELEAHLNARLFNRSTRRLELTDAGGAYVQACRRILEEVGEAERAASGEFSAPRGDLIVSAPIVFGRLHVLPVITEFLKVYRDVNVRLVLSDRVIDLLSDHVDVAVRIGEPEPSNLIVARVGETRRVVCASPAYLAENGTPKVPEELSTYKCVSFEWAASQNLWVFRRDRSAISVQIYPRLAVNTAEAAIDAAIAGGGITRVLSYQVERAVKERSLDVILREFEPAAMPVNLVHAGGSPMPLKLRAFLDYSAPRLRQRLGNDSDP